MSSDTEWGKQRSCCWKEIEAFRNWQLIWLINWLEVGKKRVRQLLLGRHVEFATFISFCGLNCGFFQQVTLNLHVLTVIGSFATTIGSFLSLPTKFQAPKIARWNANSATLFCVCVCGGFIIICNSIIWAGFIQIWLLIFRNVYTIGFVVASPGPGKAPTKFE